MKNISEKYLEEILNNKEKITNLLKNDMENIYGAFFGKKLIFLNAYIELLFELKKEVITLNKDIYLKNIELDNLMKNKNNENIIKYIKNLTEKKEDMVYEHDYITDSIVESLNNIEEKLINSEDFKIYKVLNNINNF